MDTTQIYKYIALKVFPTNDPFEYWELWRKDAEISLLEELPIQLLHILSMELLVERLFSHLKHLYGS